MKCLCLLGREIGFTEDALRTFEHKKEFHLFLPPKTKKSKTVSKVFSPSFVAPVVVCLRSVQ